jgi:putative membrane protein
MKLSRFAMSIGVAVFVSACGVAAFADQGTAKPGRGISQQDQNFINTAYQANETELRLGQIAQDKATNEDVKNFAMHMVKDHTEIGHGMTSLISEERGAIPPTIDKDHMRRADEIAAKNGADFDRAYMDAMVKDHEEAVDLFEREANADVKTTTTAWAAKVLPTLKDHLKMALQTGRVVGAPAAADDAVPAKYKERANDK